MVKIFHVMDRAGETHRVMVYGEQGIRDFFSLSHVTGDLDVFNSNPFYWYWHFNTSIPSENPSCVWLD